MLRFGDAVGLAGAHQYEAEVGGQRGIVGVDGVERKIFGGGELDDFGARRFQLADKHGVLRLRDFEIRGVMESEVAPGRDAFRLVPSSGAWGTYEHALQRADHGVAVESEAGLGNCGQWRLLGVLEIRATK